MTQSNLARSTLERLTAVDWGDEDTAFAHAVSRSRLFREYLRRSALWAQVYQATRDWPIVDLAAYIDRTVQVDAELADQLDQLMDAEVGNVRVKALCRAALRWATLLDSSTVRLPKLDDPFEPLLVMFERGGWCGLVIENRVADFSIVRVPLGKWQDHLHTEPVISLEQSVLDAIDAQAAALDKAQAAALDTPVTYYAMFSGKFTRENPHGVMRRRVVDGIDVDEAFTRDLRWEPTEYLRLYYLGHNDIDHAEITRAEVDAFIERVKQMLGTPPQES
ncbi:hypothetical protein [Kitasatospora sp. NPDC093558]|uniref:hypothetical protein n=1 Tax=Kitasatospora sp. NPDC093558 TaxID=3155201 RepID=UPI00343FBB87